MTSMHKKHKGLILPAAGIIIFYVLLSATGVFTTCYTKAFTGMPCPGCGMTRAYLCLLTLDISGAFYYHPLFLLPVIIAVLLLLQYFKGLKIHNLIWILLLFLFLGTYIVRMILFFPHTEPMTYYTGSYLWRIFFFLNDLLQR